MVSKVFEKLVNNRIVDHIEKGGLFSYFQYGFRSSQSTAGILIVVSNIIARAFKRSKATQTVALDISKVFDRVWYAGLLHKLKSYGIVGKIFCLISSFLSNRQLRVVLNGKSSQEYPAYSKCDQVSDMWQQLELASELESDLRDTLDCGKKWLVDFKAGKSQLVLFDWSDNTGSIDVKMDESVLEENSSLGYWG